MVLGLAENSTELKSQFALDLQASIPLGKTRRRHKLVILEHLETLFQVLGTFIEHAKFLKTHGDVVVGDESDVLVSCRRFKIYNFQNPLRPLQKYKCLLKLLSYCEVVGCVGQLSKNDRDLVLIDFYLLVVHSVKRVLVFSSALSCVSGGFSSNYGVTLHARGWRTACFWRTRSVGL